MQGLGLPPPVRLSVDFYVRKAARTIFAHCCTFSDVFQLLLTKFNLHVGALVAVTTISAAFASAPVVAWKHSPSSGPVWELQRLQWRAFVCCDCPSSSPLFGSPRAAVVCNMCSQTYCTRVLGRYSPTDMTNCWTYGVFHRENKQVKQKVHSRLRVARWVYWVWMPTLVTSLQKICQSQGLRVKKKKTKQERNGLQNWRAVGHVILQLSDAEWRESSCNVLP